MLSNGLSRSWRILDPSGWKTTDSIILTSRTQPRSRSGAAFLSREGFSNVYYLSTNARMCNVTAAWRAHRRGAGFANPCFTQIHPTCIPVSGDYQSKLTLMSESLRNDGRIWVPREGDESRVPADIPEAYNKTGLDYDEIVVEKLR